MVPKHYYKLFQLVFEQKGFDELPPQRPWDYAIDLVSDAMPNKPSKVYPISPQEQKELDKFLNDNLKSRRIRPSKSLYGAGFLFVKKKDGKLRLVQDYWKLNAVTVKNAYPLPLISEVIGKLHHARVFSKMDIR